MEKIMLHSKSYVKPYVENGVVHIPRQTANPTRHYEVPLEQVNTLEKLVLKQQFMQEKTWYTDQINDDFFEVVVYAQGWQQ